MFTRREKYVKQSDKCVRLYESDDFSLQNWLVDKFCKHGFKTAYERERESKLDLDSGVY